MASAAEASVVPNGELNGTSPAPAKQPTLEEAAAAQMKQLGKINAILSCLLHVNVSICLSTLFNHKHDEKIPFVAFYCIIAFLSCILQTWKEISCLLQLHPSQMEPLELPAMVVG